MRSSLPLTQHVRLCLLALHTDSVLYIASRDDADTAKARLLEVFMGYSTRVFSVTPPRASPIACVLNQLFGKHASGVSCATLCWNRFTLTPAASVSVWYRPANSASTLLSTSLLCGTGFADASGGHHSAQRAGNVPAGSSSRCRPSSSGDGAMTLEALHTCRASYPCPSLRSSRVELLCSRPNLSAAVDGVHEVVVLRRLLVEGERRRRHHQHLHSTQVGVQMHG